MLINDLLPIGSVVMLNGGQKKLMIFGVKQANKVDESDSKEYDYIGVLYPEGNVGNRHQYLFNQNDIESVEFRGYENEERTAFLERLAGFYQETAD